MKHFIFLGIVCISIPVTCSYQEPKTTLYEFRDTFGDLPATHVGPLTNYHASIQVGKIGSEVPMTFYWSSAKAPDGCHFIKNVYVTRDGGDSSSIVEIVERMEYPETCHAVRVIDNSKPAKDFERSRVRYKWTKGSTILNRFVEIYGDGSFQAVRPGTTE